MRNIDVKNFICDGPNGCSCIFTISKEFNNIHDEYIVHKIIHSDFHPKDDPVVHRTEAQQHLEQLQKTHHHNKFKISKIEDNDKLPPYRGINTHFEIHLTEFIYAVIRENDSYVVIYCPKCNKEFYRVSK